MRRALPLCVLALCALLLAACGGRDAKVTTPTDADRAQCRATVAAIEARIAALTEEKRQVEHNKSQLPPGYDTASIDQTLAQIQSEIDSRAAALPGQKGRCAAMDE
jgi:ABC-type glycerol-3-phosphate transport system substrate-binding protein